MRWMLLCLGFAPQIRMQRARAKSGKSTLAKLMARAYDPTSGAVRFGGVGLREATLDSLRERILVVPQEGELRFWTEFGRIEVEPGEIAVIPRGVKVRVELKGGRLMALTSGRSPRPSPGSSPAPTYRPASTRAC